MVNENWNSVRNYLNFHFHYIYKNHNLHDSNNSTYPYHKINLAKTAVTLLLILTLLLTQMNLTSRKYWFLLSIIIIFSFIFSSRIIVGFKRKKAACLIMYILKGILKRYKIILHSEAFWFREILIIAKFHDWLSIKPHISIWFMSFIAHSTIKYVGNDHLILSLSYYSWKNSHSDSLLIDKFLKFSYISFPQTSCKLSSGGPTNTRTNWGTYI
jgi:hypothetical protein